MREPETPDDISRLEAIVREFTKAATALTRQLKQIESEKTKQPTKREGEQSKQLSKQIEEQFKQQSEREEEQSTQPSERTGEQFNQPCENGSEDDGFSLLAEIKELSKRKENETLKKMIANTEKMNEQIQHLQEKIESERK